MSINITAKWDTAKGHGFEDGQQILLFGFDGNGQWDEAGQLVTVTRGRRIVLTDAKGKQVWAGGTASKFWATPLPVEEDPKAKRTAKAPTKGNGNSKAPAKAVSTEALLVEEIATEAIEQATKAPAKAELSTQDKRLAALDKAREARKAAADAPAPEVDGITFRTSGKHGLKEGSTFTFHGDSKADGPGKASPKLTMKIVDRVWITGVDSKGKEQMRAHIAKSFWAVKLSDPAPVKEAPAKAEAKAPAKGNGKTASPARSRKSAAPVVEAIVTKALTKPRSSRKAK